MFEFPLLFLRCLFAGFQSRSGLVFENLALRHQLAVLKRQVRKPKLRCADRLLWVGLRLIWPQWQKALLLFQPQTIISCSERIGFPVMPEAPHFESGGLSFLKSENTLPRTAGCPRKARGEKAPSIESGAKFLLGQAFD